MELRTYTHLWDIDRRLYSINDLKLPVPLGMRQLGVLIAASLTWMPFLALINFPFSSPFHVVWFAIPGGLAYMSGKPIREGKRMGELVLSQIRYSRQSREYARLAPCAAPLSATARAAVWTPASFETPAYDAPAAAPPLLLLPAASVPSQRPEAGLAATERAVA